MTNADMMMYGIPLAVLLLGGLGFFVMQGGRARVLDRRIDRVTRRGTAIIKSAGDPMSLRRKTSERSIPLLSAVLKSLPNSASLQERLDKGGMKIRADMLMALSLAIVSLTVLAFALLHKPIGAGVALGFFLGVFIPRFVVNFRVNRRLKRFLSQFPDAIDYIVRGLRSGLPVTESMNMVGQEMGDPVGPIFSSVGESVKLGVTLEKALQDTAKKLGLTEFNFFVTSIILQRETGGNLSEILSNLSEVLRKRFMMRMKIKAMASEAKASAMIVGSLPFIVIVALTFIAPDYLHPLIDETSGNIAAGCAALSLTIGITVMIKMAQFEI